MNDNHTVAEFPQDHCALDQFHQEVMSIWKIVRATQETIEESRQLLERIDRLLTPLIE
jgi:hypothetical protein